MNNHPGRAGPEPPDVPGRGISPLRPPKKEQTRMAPAEALNVWEILHPSDTERAATVEALKEALEEMRAGDIGIPAREFFADLRSK